MHGKVFMSFIFAIDTIFEMMYCLFPLIYFTSKKDDFSLNLQSIGILGEQNFFIFFQSLFASAMLLRKCNLLLSDLNPVRIVKQYWIRRIETANNRDNTNSTKKQYDPWIRTQSDPTSKTNMWYIAITSQSQSLMALNREINQIYINTRHKKNNDNNNNNNKNQNNDDENETESAEHDVLVPVKKSKSNLSVMANDKPEKVETKEKQNQTQQCYRKMVVGIFGTALIMIGVLILVMFLGFIYNEFEPKCINPTDAVESNSLSAEWLTNHPELKIYKKYCKKQVINVFNYHYPCNCRLFGISETLSTPGDMYNDNITITQEQLEKSLIKYTNLEGISIELSDKSRISNDNRFYLNDKMFDNLGYLKVLRLVNMNIHHIDKSIKKLNNLEIFLMDYNDARFFMPFDSISQLQYLKALELKYTPSMNNSIIPDSICNLKLIRYLEITVSYEITSFPWHCISKNWNNLAYFLATFFEIHFVDPNFWLLPSLNSVFFNHMPLNESILNFDTFVGFSDALSVVTLYGNTQLCGQTNDNWKIIINGTQYDGFGYLNYNDDIYDHEKMYPLLSFIAKFDPCFSVCNHSSTVVSCTSRWWKDGVCDNLCNNEECYWDGGDCVQSCDTFGVLDHDHQQAKEPCNYTLLFNDECNFGCNTTQCNFDLGHCISTTSINDTCTTGIDNKSACYTKWSTDFWCDTNCNNSECGYDNNLCNQCIDDVGANECRRAYWLMIEITASKYKPYELIDLNETCLWWDIFSVVYEIPGNVSDCLQYFQLTDTNNNGYVGFYEAIVAISSAFGIEDEEKLTQIDCSLCMKNKSLYYW